jgi:hypothetical protein
MHVMLEVHDFTISFQKNMEKGDDFLTGSPKKGNEARKFSELRGDDGFEKLRSQSEF